MNKFFNSPMVSFVLGVFVIMGAIQYDYPVSLISISQDTPLFQLQVLALFWNGLLAKIAGPWFLGNGMRGLIIQAMIKAKTEE